MANSITPIELLKRLGQPDSPFIVDVTLDEDFDLDPFILPTASRERHTDIEDWGPDYRARSVVVVCQKGLKLSQGAAAWLAEDGAEALFLEGGNVGWADLPEAPRMTWDGVFRSPSRRQRWVGTENDRAAAWFIRRFVDREARIMIVTDTALEAVAARFDASKLGPLTRMMSDIQMQHAPLAALNRALEEQGAFSLGSLLRTATDPECVLDAAYAAAREAGK